MRASIVVWSTISGAVLGMFIDATLISVALLISAIVPGVSARLHHRWVTITSAAILGLIPLTLAVLGFLEGQLKTR